MDKKIKVNVVFNLIYQIVAIIIPLVTTPYLSRVLGVDNMGIQSYTLSIVSYFTLFAAFGLNDYGQREVARFRNDEEKVSKLFWELMLNRFLTSAIVLGVYGILVSTVLEANYTIYYLIMIMNILAITFDVAWFFQGLEHFKTLAVRNTIIKLLGLIAIFAFVKTENDLWIYVLINSLSLFLSAISVWMVLKKYLVKVKIQLKSIFSHFKGSFVYFIPSIAIQIYTVLDKSMIQWITNSNAQNGYYEQAERIVKVSLTVIQVTNIIMRSRMSYLFETGELDEAKSLCNTSLSFLSILMYPFVAGIILVAPEVVPIYLGEGYEESIILLQIFSFLVLFIGTSGLIGSHYMTPVGKQGTSNIVLICGSCINLILNLILIPRYEAVGAAIASITAEFFIAAMYMFNARKFIKPIEFLKIGYKHIIAAVAMFFAVYFTCKNLAMNDWLILTIKVCEGVGVYFALLFILRDKTLLHFTNKIFAKIRR